MESRAGTQAVDRCFAILDAVAGGPVTITALSERLGLARPTVARLVAALERHGFVAAGAGGLCRLGTRPLELAGRWRDQNGLADLVQRHLEELVTAYEESAYLLVRDGLRSFCVSGVESPRAVRFSARIGAYVDDLHAGAMHKALLAFSPAPTVEAVLAAPLRRYTAATIVDADELRAELERIRRRGYAESHGEMDEGVYVIAAAACGADGEAMGAIGVAGLDSRADETLLARIRRDVARRARAISAELGFKPRRRGVTGRTEKEERSDATGSG